MTHNKDANSRQEFVLVASIPDRALKSALSALDRAGIAYEFDGARGAIGFRVSPSDMAHSKDILKADAQLHHYEITFVD